MRIKIPNLLDLKRVEDEYQTFSFDVFDTLIFRTVEDYDFREFHICELMQKKLSEYDINTSALELVDLRRIEFAKTKITTGDEVDYYKYLDDILDYFFAPKETRETLKKELLLVEEEYELSITYPNCEAIEVLKYLKKKGKNIIAICDMYLPGNSVRKILNKAELLQYIDNIYVSSDCEFCSKATGRIYDFLKDNTENNFNTTIHTGDNESSDCTIALEHCISSAYYYNERNEQRKKKIVQYIPASISFKRIITAKRRTIIDVLPQTFAVFIKKIVEEANEKNANVIYLLTRDADFLYEPFSCYIQKKNLKIRIKILHIDRISSFFLNLTNYHELYNVLFLFKNDGEFISLNKLISKLYPSEEIINRYADKINIFGDKDAEVLLRSDVVSALINEIIDDRRNNIIKYLENEGLFNKDNSVIVDIGYSGTTEREISNYIKNNNVDCGRIDYYLYASNEFFRNNAIIINPPVYMHRAIILPYLNNGSLAYTNFSWLEPFVLDNKMGPLKGYCCSEPIRSFNKNVSTVYERYGLVTKTTKILNDQTDTTFDIASLLKAVLLPSQSDIEACRDVAHCKNYDNSLNDSMFITLSLKNLRQDYKKMLDGDYWIGGSFKKSHLTWIVFIVEAVGKERIKRFKKYISRLCE